MTHLDAVRERSGISKADLARSIDTKPEVVRRLMAARSSKFGLTSKVGWRDPDGSYIKSCFLPKRGGDPRSAPQTRRTMMMPSTTV